jgi:DNA polymerase III epsilon subunit-like protein
LTLRIAEMSELRDTEVFVLDCQSTGATPELGDLLELGWTITSGTPKSEPVRAHWVVPRSGRRVPRIVRELTGFRDDCLATALAPEDCWTLLKNDVSAHGGSARAVIHFAHFELAFLRDLHARIDADGSSFPFDAVCLHAIARRLYPDLARRSLRALAGMHGFPSELVRRSEGHVKATAHLWHALLPELERRGLRTWIDLHGWLEEPAPKRTRRRYPLPPEKRRLLPTGPGVYRFLRSNGDILYVGKATSLKQRVASHFSSAQRATERALEMLTQVSDIAVTKTASILEAALLEHAEITRIDPPYNVQLREGDRAAWFASKDLLRARPAPDDEHRIGPLPSRWAVAGLGAIRALAAGAEATTEMRARATAVPNTFAPDEGTFAAGWALFVAEPGATGGEKENSDDETPPSGWDTARVQRRLDRAWLGGRQLVRRSRWLVALADSVVVFREADDIRRRRIVLSGGEIASIDDDDASSAITVAARRVTAFDRAGYDRLRVLVTELGRILGEGGDVTVHVGRHRVVLRRP